MLFFDFFRRKNSEEPKTIAEVLTEDHKPIQQEIATVSQHGTRNIQSSYPSENLSPGRLASILKESDTGVTSRQMELYEEIEEKDDEIFSLLQTRKSQVAGLDWDVKPVDDSQQQKENAEFVKQTIKDIPHFSKAITHLLDAIAKGYAVQEIIWGVKNGQNIVERLEWRHQKHFRWDEETASELRLLDDRNIINGLPIPDKKFIIPIMLAKSGIPARGALLRICVWLYMFKNFSMKDWTIFIEVFGMPIRVGKYDNNAGVKDKEVLLSAIRLLSQDTAVMIPKSMEIEFIESKKTGSIDVYERFQVHMNKQLSKVILGQTLTSDAGDKGSFSLGKVHNEIRRLLQISDAKQLSETLTHDLSRPITIFNKGVQDRYPEFILMTDEPEDTKDFPKDMETLVNSGHDRIPISFVNKKMNIPELKEGEPALKIDNQVLNPLTAKQNQESDLVMASKKKLRQLRGGPM